MKLPRKLKKRLKVMLIDSMCWREVWRSKEVKIKRFEPYIHAHRVPRLTLGTRTITAYEFSNP